MCAYRLLSQHNLEGPQLCKCGVTIHYNGNRDSVPGSARSYWLRTFFKGHCSVPIMTSFISTGTTSIASWYQFQTIRRVCHLLVIWGGTVKPVTRRFPFLQCFGWLKS